MTKKMVIMSASKRFITITSLALMTITILIDYQLSKDQTKRYDSYAQTIEVQNRIHGRTGFGIFTSFIGLWLASREHPNLIYAFISFVLNAITSYLFISLSIEFQNLLILWLWSSLQLVVTITTLLYSLFLFFGTSDGLNENVVDETNVNFLSIDPKYSTDLPPPYEPPPPYSE